jgi:peptidoglycan/LPS O-acetylase OafA/YrhL
MNWQNPVLRRIDAFDSVRAIAVMGVIATHMGLLPGGFIGVDVFFVISGYVITLLLLRNRILDARFSYAEFYRQRVNRIVPPLLVVSIFVFAIANAIFWDMADYQFISRSYAYQAFLAQNLFFSLWGSEYFQGPVYAKFNLHTWSLAVEEQFYLIFPLAFMILMRKAKSVLDGAKICALVLIAFVAFIWIFQAGLLELFNSKAHSILGVPPQNNRIEAIRFYLLPTRAWELLAGSIACLLVAGFHERVVTKTNKVLVAIDSTAILGCSIMLASLFLIKETMLWPSLLTLGPVLGTCLLLGALHMRQTIGSPLPIVPFSLVGKMSYSLYLWHWPILCFFMYTNFDFLNRWYDSVIYLALVVLFSAVTYALLEKRRHRISPPRFVGCPLSICSPFRFGRYDKGADCKGVAIHQYDSRNGAIRFQGVQHLRFRTNLRFHCAVG